MAGTLSCARQPPPARKSVELWHTLGSWSGRDNVQTESFVSETGSLRVQWETRNETKPNAGTFKLTINSAISGRPIVAAVDHRGLGGGTAYVGDDPRSYYAVVESSNLDWTFTVQEGFSGTAVPK
jgi:hypothetical protein